MNEGNRLEAALAALAYRQTLSDLLCWAESPDSQPLQNGWDESYDDKVNVQSSHLLDTLTKVHEGDPEAIEYVKQTVLRSRRNAVQFTRIMKHTPTLASIPAFDWEIPRYVEYFNSLHESESEIRQIECQFRKGVDLPTEEDNEEDREDNPQKNENRVPENQDVLELCLAIYEHRDTGIQKIVLAKEITNGDGKRAKNILRQARRPEFRWLCEGGNKQTLSGG